jgi:RecB family endonuclease NucS
MTTSHEEVSFSIDLGTLEVAAMPEIKLQSVGIKERTDLQRWISAYPEIVGRDLLLVTTEFDQWELRDKKVDDRLDVLFLETDGTLLVAELKRDKAEDTTELQALKYAAYCSQLTVEDLVDAYSRVHEVTGDEARQALVDHAPALAEGEVGGVRIRLVAGEFGPSVTSVDLWLRDHDIDIGCIEVTARQSGPDSAVLSALQIIPLPAAEDYLVRRRRKEQEEEERKTRERRKETSAALLIRTKTVVPGDLLTLKVEQFAKSVQPKIAALVAAEPDVAIADWTGDVHKPLRWRSDGEVYSATGLVNAILAEVGVSVKTIPGPDYWTLPSGRSMYEESKVVEEQADAENGAPSPSPALSVDDGSKTSS